MKVLFRQNVLLLLLLVFVPKIFPSTSFGLSRLSFLSSQKDPPSVRDIWSTNPGDVLSHALSRTFAFPSSLQHNPAYASAIDIFRSLESKPSCHRSAAASLVLDCSSLEGKPQDGGLKISYAAQLAICEFEATGISFPRECKDLDRGKWLEVRVMKCVKKLEERPQWWTTLSNNIQNAVVMCSAIKHEVEKDQLLTLHKNITKAQRSLFTALQTSLTESWESITAQKEFAGTWRNFLSDVLGELMQTKREVVDAARAADADAIAVVRRFIEEVENVRKNNREAVVEIDQVKTTNWRLEKMTKNMNQLIHRAADGLEGLDRRSNMMIEAAGRAMREYFAGATAQHSAIKRNSDLIEQVNTVLSSEMGPSIDALLHAVDVLSFKIVGADCCSPEKEESLIKLEKFGETSDSYSSLLTSLSISYMDLAKSHIALTTSLSAQEEGHRRLLSLLEMANLSANATFEMLVGMFGTLSQSLDDIDVKIQSWNRNGMGQTWMPLGALILGSGILLGREGGGIVLILAGVIVGVILFFVGFLYFRDFIEILDLRDLRPSSTAIRVSSDGGLGAKSHGMLSRGLAIWAGSVLAVTLIVIAVLFIVLRRRRCSVPTNKDLE